MSSQFDSLIEQYLTELMPAELGIGAPMMAKKIAKKAADAPMSGHWKAIKRLPDTEQAILDILKTVFPEKDNTYNPDIDNKQELKAAILDAIQDITQKKGYAEKFAADRVTTATVEETAFELASAVMDKNAKVTQKEVRQKLNKKLEAKPTEETESNTVYFKSADTPDDGNLAKAFKKLPDDKDMTKQEVLNIVKDEALVSELIRSGALISKEAEPEEPEQKEGEGTGEVTTGIDNDDLDTNFDDTIDRLIGGDINAPGMRDWD